MTGPTKPFALSATKYRQQSNWACSSREAFSTRNPVVKSGTPTWQPPIRLGTKEERTRQIQPLTRNSGCCITLTKRSSRKFERFERNHSGGARTPYQPSCGTRFVGQPKAKSTEHTRTVSSLTCFRQKMERIPLSGIPCGQEN